MHRREFTMLDRAQSAILLMAYRGPSQTDEVMTIVCRLRELGIQAELILVTSKATELRLGPQGSETVSLKKAIHLLQDVDEENPPKVYVSTSGPAYITARLIEAATAAQYIRSVYFVHVKGRTCTIWKPRVPKIWWIVEDPAAKTELTENKQRSIDFVAGFDDESHKAILRRWAKQNGMNIKEEKKQRKLSVT